MKSSWNLPPPSCLVQVDQTYQAARWEIVTHGRQRWIRYTGQVGHVWWCRGDAGPRGFWGHWGEVPVVEDSNFMTVFVCWRSSWYFGFHDLSETSSSWSAVSDLCSQSFFMAWRVVSVWTGWYVDWPSRLSLIVNITEFTNFVVPLRSLTFTTRVDHGKGDFFAAVFFSVSREALSPKKRKKWCPGSWSEWSDQMSFLWLKTPQVWVEQNHLTA